MTLNKEYNVSDFLAENVKQERTTKEVKISGYKKPFVIQSVTSEEFDQMQKQATRKLINKKTYQEIEKTDNGEYGDLLEDIQKISGFEIDKLSDFVERAKN